MSQSRLNHKIFLKKFTIVFIPIVSLIIIISFLIYYYQYIKPQEKIFRSNEISLISFQKEFVKLTIKTIISDIKVIASQEMSEDFLVKKSRKNQNLYLIVLFHIVNIKEFMTKLEF